jgi:hypothetical protein
VVKTILSLGLVLNSAPFNPFTFSIIFLIPFGVKFGASAGFRFGLNRDKKSAAVFPFVI